MLTIDVTLTLPTAKLTITKDAIAANNGYNATDDGTKAEFTVAQAKKALTAWVNDQFRRHVENQATTALDTDAEIT